ERDEDFRLHGADEFRNLRWPVRILGRLASDPRALGEIPVGPDVDDLVQRPDLGVQEGGQLRVLLAVLVALPETLLDLGQAPGRDAVGADLVDHGAAPFGGDYSPDRGRRS